MNTEVFTLLEKIESIQQDDTIQVLYAHFDSGISEEHIKWLENEYKIKFTDEIASFYSTVNGLQLMWISKSNPAYDPDQHFYSDGSFSIDLPRQKEIDIDGCINIWPIGDILNQNWMDITYFDTDNNHSILYNNKTISLLDLKKKFLPFDLFSKEECVGLFSINNDSNINSLIMGSDYYTNIRYSKSTSLNAYIKFLTDTMGNVDMRRKLFDGSKAFEFSQV